MNRKSQKVDLRIKLTSPFLGSKLDSSAGVMRFDTKYKDSTVYWKPDLEQWRWSLTSAIDSLSDENQSMTDIDVDFVSFSLLVKAPAIRKFVKSQISRNPMRNRTFESFSAGTVITIPVMLLGCMEHDRMGRSQARPPTVDELKECFSLIGERIGLSPWGNIYGYGRFDVL